MADELLVAWTNRGQTHAAALGEGGVTMCGKSTLMWRLRGIGAPECLKCIAALAKAEAAK